MKYALIGCGRISPKHILSALECNLQIVAICDSNIIRAKELKELYNLGKTKIYHSYQEMLTKEKPYLTAIATPSGNHYSIASEVLNCSSHVIIEKPMALCLNQCSRLISMASHRNLLLSVCHQNRFNPTITKLKEALFYKELGVISHGSLKLRWHRSEDYYNMDRWRGSWQFDGGVLTNQTIHGIDALLWLMDSPVQWVQGSIARRFHSIQAEDLAMAVIKFSTGALATIEGSTNIYKENLEETLSVFGSEGSVKISGKALNTIDLWESSKRIMASEKHSITDIYGDGHKALYSDMVTAITTGSKPLIDGCDGRKAMEVILAIYKSHKENRPIKLPLNDFSTMDMMGVDIT